MDRDILDGKPVPVDVREERNLDRLIDLARTRRRIVAFTGAGISTESGIPDYRGPGGVWEQRKPPTIGDFLENPETRRQYWQRRLHDYPILAARQPNAGHLALAGLERAGLLVAVITQNIDGLHQKAGNSSNRVFELHGTAHKIRCIPNSHVWDGSTIQRLLESGAIEPTCSTCGGMLRSATVLFGEPLPQDAWTNAVDAASHCDLMLVVGTSLVVHPAAQLPVMAKRAGALVVIINRTQTPLDSLAAVRLFDEAGPALSKLAEALLQHQ